MGSWRTIFPWNDLPGQCLSSGPQPLPVVGPLSVWFLSWQPWENGQMKNRLIRRGIIVVALLATLPGMPIVAAQALDEAVAAYERGDYATAIRGFRKAAEQGNAASQINLGHAYAEGRGAPQDYQEALKWYRKAAEQGYVPAQVHLGTLYFEGRIVLQSYQESAKWFRKAADQGDALGQFNLGHMYRLGHGVSQDDFQAHKWFNLAASLTTGEVADHSRLARDNLAEVMTDSQVYEAQRLAREWQPKAIGPKAGPVDMNTLKKALEWSSAATALPTVPSSTPSAAT